MRQKNGLETNLIGEITKKLCVLDIQSNTTIFHLAVQ